MATPLCHEYTYKRSDFLVESLQDQQKQDQYKSMTYLHAGLRHREGRQGQQKWTQLLPSLKEFVKLQYTEVEGSVFVWLAVIPGIPNSPKVLLHTVQLLTDLFIHTKKMKNIIITADAVEYNALYKIRSDYGALMGHIYLYYGMWHAIVNFLKQFFKAYRNAGVEVMF